MFARFTQPETGLPIHFRVSRIQAVAAAEDGTTRIFLGGALSCLVAENEDEVLRAIQADDDGR